MRRTSETDPMRVRRPPNEEALSHLMRTLVIVIFERRCPVCASPHRTLCPGCVDQLELSGPIAVPGLDAVTALFVYDAASARLVLAGKNGGRRDLMRWAGELLGRQAERLARPDVVTWVPAHPAQRRRRGFDQGQILARGVAASVGVPARRLLRRSGGASRKGLDRSARLVGPSVRSRSTSGVVMLVDDVSTTGSSLMRCAEALRRSGADRVIGAVVAASTANFCELPAQLGDTIYIGRPSGVRPAAT